MKKLIILNGLFKTYNEQGIRCFAIEKGEIDQQIWKKTEKLEDREDLMLYFTMRNYDLGFIGIDGVKMVIKIVIEKGQLKQFEITELYKGGINGSL
jgi:hypothetical protein